MRKRVQLPVCSCSPRGEIYGMESRTLDQMLVPALRTMRRLGQRRHTARMLWMANSLADTCLRSGRPLRAVEIWCWAISRAEWNDQEWEYTPINTRYYTFAGVTHAHLCEQMACRADLALRSMGFVELTGMLHAVRVWYRQSWAEKYDVCWSDYAAVLGLHCC